MHFNLRKLLLSTLSIIVAVFIFNLFAIQTQAASIYYVSPTGNNTNSGTIDQPWKTIQNCLNIVKAGDTCFIREGTYNESLSIVTSGANGAIITLQNYNGETVTVNSGSSMTLKTTGHQSYYTVDGLRLISTISGGEGITTIDFANGWPNNETVQTGGNSNIILKNCYVEGAVLFYGPNNVVENCEFSGKNILNDAIHYRYYPSTNGIINNNIIHDYLGRAVWAMSSVDNILIENNTIYNTYLGIDCDGARIPDTKCRVIKNIIYNSGRGTLHTDWGCGIFLENAFNAVIDKNLIFNSPTGDGMYIINYGNGPNWFTKDNTEYRNLDLNMTLSNNIIYNSPGNAAILDYAASGIKMYNNTISQLGSVAMIAVSIPTGTSFYAQHLDVRNNIFSGSGGLAAWKTENPATISNSTFSNNLYYGRTATLGEQSISNNPLFVGTNDFHLQSNSPAIDAGITVAIADDFDGNTRPQGKWFDIGAYEYSSNQPSPTPTLTPTPTQSFLVGDVNKDHVVNIQDYILLSNAFGTNNTAADLNSDGTVNVQDYIILSNNFGKSS